MLVTGELIRGACATDAFCANCGDARGCEPMVVGDTEISNLALSFLTGDWGRSVADEQFGTRGMDSHCIDFMDFWVFESSITGRDDTAVPELDGVWDEETTVGTSSELDSVTGGHFFMDLLARLDS